MGRQYKWPRNIDNQGDFREMGDPVLNTFLSLNKIESVFESTISLLYRTLGLRVIRSASDNRNGCHDLVVPSYYDHLSLGVT
jgi:hypothetical protein